MAQNWSPIFKIPFNHSYLKDLWPVYTRTVFSSDLTSPTVTKRWLTLKPTALSTCVQCLQIKLPLNTGLV